MSGFQPKNNLGWIFVEIMLQPEINQNTTLKWRQVSNIKSTMVGFWLDFGCLTSQPDFNHGTTLKSGCVPSGCFHPFFTSFDAPVPILTHLGASFDSPEAFFLVVCNFFFKYGKVSLEYRLQVSP